MKIRLLFEKLCVRVPEEAPRTTSNDMFNRKNPSTEPEKLIVNLVQRRNGNV